MARDPRIMHVEKRDGELHILSDEELDEKEAVQRVVVRMFFIISIILGPGLMGLVDLFSDYHPSYVGAFVIANAITTALTIVVKYPDRTGETILAGTAFFLVAVGLALALVEWLVGFGVTDFKIPFFWVLVGAFPFYMNWKNAKYLGAV